MATFYSNYVQKLEAYNSSQFPTYCPTLKYSHVYLQALKEMNVAKAVQVSKLLYNVKNFQDMALPNPAGYHNKKSLFNSPCVWKPYVNLQYW